MLKTLKERKTELIAAAEAEAQSLAQRKQREDTYAKNFGQDAMLFAENAGKKVDVTYPKTGLVKLEDRAGKEKLVCFESPQRDQVNVLISNDGDSFSSTDHNSMLDVVIKWIEGAQRG